MHTTLWHSWVGWLAIPSCTFCASPSQHSTHLVSACCLLSCDEYLPVWCIRGGCCLSNSGALVSQLFDTLICDTYFPLVSRTSATALSAKRRKGALHDHRQQHTRTLSRHTVLRATHAACICSNISELSEPDIALQVPQELGRGSRRTAWGGASVNC